MSAVTQTTSYNYTSSCKKFIYFLLFIITENYCNCEILFWSHRNLHQYTPSPINLFNNEHFQFMLDVLKPEFVLAFINNKNISSNNINRNSSYNNNNRNNRNRNTVIADLNLPKFRQLVESSTSVYIPNNLPLTFGENLTTVILDGTDGEKDIKITGTYQNVIKVHHADNMLALLLNPISNQSKHRQDSSGGQQLTNLIDVRHQEKHVIKRRATSTNSRDKLPDYGPGIYYVKDRAMLYTRLYPVLKMRDENDKDVEYILKKSALETADIRDQVTRLIISFSLQETTNLGSKVVLRFRFITSTNGYWSLNIVELQDFNHNNLILSTQQAINAPKGFSYHCTGNTVFKNGSTSLILTNIQVQPAPIASKRFDDAYDCINFTTVPIWSGLLVTAILGVALTLAIIAISNIRTMDRFDDPKGTILTVNID